jgi:hypothetical protein
VGFGVEGLGVGVEGLGVGVEGCGLGLADREGFGLGEVEGFGVDRLGLAEALGLGDGEGSSGSAGGATPGPDGRAVTERLDGLDGLGVGDALGDVEGVRTIARVVLGLDALGVLESLAIAPASPPSASTVAAAEVITRRFTESVLPRAV